MLKGTYIIKEVKAPDYYILNEHNVYFVQITKNGEYVTHFELRFGTVKAGFKETEWPRVYAGQKALMATSSGDTSTLSIAGSKSMHNQNAYMNVIVYFVGRIYTESGYTWDGKYLTYETDEFGFMTSYDYADNGNLTSVVDRRGYETTYDYDTMNRITRILKSDVAVNYTYTKDKLTNISNNGYNYELIYDVFGNLKITKVANRTLMTNNYEENNGSLTSSTYGNNQSISYEYDRFSRKSKEITQDNTYTFAYDKRGNLAYIDDNSGRKDYLYDITNKLIMYSHNDYLAEYEYDESNNLSKQTQTFGNTTKTYEYNYDRAGRLNNFKLDNLLQMYKYDRYSRVDSITLKSGNYEKTIEYEYKNVGGNRYSNLVQEVFDSDTRVWYNYDENQNIIEIQEDYETVYEYEYDEFNQLVKEHNAKLNKPIEYTYDNGGNLLTKTEYEYKTTNVIKTTTYTYDSTWKDLLVSYDGKAITTDAIGNVLTYDGKTYSWRNGRELAGITGGNNTISYTYNEDGVRTSKTVNGVTTTYELNGTNVVYEKTGDTIIYYIYDGVGDIVGFEYSGNKYYYKKNLQGDIVGIYDNTLQEIVSYTYDSWGKLVSIKDASGQEITSTTHVGYINPYRYRSYRYDNESGLYYLQSRYYNADWGRFISADEYLATGQDLQGNNMFCYCVNNPINYTDFNGTFSFKEFATDALNLVAKAASYLVSDTFIIAAAYVTSLLGLENAAPLLVHSLDKKPADVYYNENSNISKALSTSNTVKTAINSGDMSLKFNTSELDLFLAIGKADIEVQKTNSNYTVSLVDRYDFKLEEYNFNKADLLYDVGMFVNNVAFYRQERGLIRNYKTHIVFKYVIE